MRTSRLKRDRAQLVIDPVIQGCPPIQRVASTCPKDKTAPCHYRVVMMIPSLHLTTWLLSNDRLKRLQRLDLWEIGELSTWTNWTFPSLAENIGSNLEAIEVREELRLMRLWRNIQRQRSRVLRYNFNQPAAYSKGLMNDKIVYPERENVNKLFAWKWYWLRVLFHFS